MFFERNKLEKLGDKQQQIGRKITTEGEDRDCNFTND